MTKPYRVVHKLVPSNEIATDDKKGNKNGTDRHTATSEIDEPTDYGEHHFLYNLTGDETIHFGRINELRLHLSNF